jgi:prepilin-type N-terminal cleavage/methylation domain-containing protein
MMLRIGNSELMRGNRKGFTLLEVMVAAAVLSLGIVFIFESFLSISNTSDYCVSYITSSAFAHEKLWEAAENVRREGTLPAEVSGEFIRSGKKFDWDLLMESAGMDTVYRVSLQLQWSSGKKHHEVKRSEYVSYEKTE